VSEIEMTEEQKQFCVQTAQWMDRIKTFPGGPQFIADMFRAMCSKTGLTVVDEADPKVGIRREITQELYDALWVSRELRERGYTMQTAGNLGIADLYAMHGTGALQRYLKIVTDNALHNAGLEGFARAASPKQPGPK
jgi:hypothetical protein